ncbi:hypothetical protein F5X68DRAFT_240310 [Plectosphaerella plurivora]|uniref:Uncharacterized protein n=1 Tax=Plectosphaerella plurivora TaxID=936078 RepID=A0A9P9AAR6_9PEZI|nr:hypothetical protein F5X68DRAFT_240310 [Plectosphaerella plurivora]
MASPPQRLLTEVELNRLRACADENTVLANCWNKPHVAVVTMEWAPVGFTYHWRDWISRNENRGSWNCHHETPVLTLEIAEFPPNGASSSSSSSAPKFRRHTFWIRSRMALWSHSRWWQHRLQQDEGNGEKTYYEPENITLAEIYKLFAELAKVSPSLCICSHRPDQTMRALEKMGFRRPKNAVFVDLIKVLDHQSRTSGVPTELETYVKTRLYANPRTGGHFEEIPEAADGDEKFLDFYDTSPRYGRKGEWREIIRRSGDVSAQTVLAIVGPKAALHRRDMERVEKDNIALDKIAKAAARDRKRK